ncbi:unnamed protein product [Prorocentrum cordatum]|uniref:Uncharacterized protein n=1 Tax=Prorocentrum cordatum TaxID=2364126 RepID=A0ABN9QGV4_9DINO|nr:unnamed protein product [Polarella glacialis]
MDLQDGRARLHAEQARRLAAASALGFQGTAGQEADSPSSAADGVHAQPQRPARVGASARADWRASLVAQVNPPGEGSAGETTAREVGDCAAAAAGREREQRRPQQCSWLEAEGQEVKCARTQRAERGGPFIRLLL